MQASQEVRRLAEKNTRLIEENETLIHRLQGPSTLGEAQVAAASGAASGPASVASSGAGASIKERGRAASMLKKFAFGRRKDT